MIRRVVYIFIFFVKAIGCIYAQDAQYTQYYAAQSLLAPSFAGTTNGGRVALNFRDQWPTIPKEFISYNFAFDYFFRKYNSGIGFYTSRDHAGIGNLTSTSIGLQYSYKIKVNRLWQIRPGVQFNYCFRSINFNKLLFGDQISLYGIRDYSIEPQSYEKIYFYDFATSAIAFGKDIWFGLAFDHIGNANQSLTATRDPIPLKASIFGGKKLVLQPHIGSESEESLFFTTLFKTQGKFDQLDLGVLWSKLPFVIGMNYRGLPFATDYKGLFNQDAISMIIGYDMEQYRIGYSFDMTISRLSGNSGGAHEISFVLLFNQTHKKKYDKWREISCPVF